jgi:hypothetical protein
MTEVTAQASGKAFLSTAGIKRPPAVAHHT